LPAAIIITKPVMMKKMSTSALPLIQTGMSADRR